MKKRRLLDLLAERFPNEAKKELHARILCGEVRADGLTERNPKRVIPERTDIEWVGPGAVGRGGDKLEAALQSFRPACEQQVVLDAGSSTGGFTERLLARGARSVYAIDVGTNQLAWRLRQDERVVVMENTNIADVRREDLSPMPSFAVCDLSFRSLRGIAGHIAGLTAERRLIALSKPQFEWHLAARDRGYERETRFDGVVSDADGAWVMDCLERALAAEGLRVRARIESPVRGRRGNLEYFLDLVG